MKKKNKRNKYNVHDRVWIETTLSGSVYIGPAHIINIFNESIEFPQFVPQFPYIVNIIVPSAQDDKENNKNEVRTVNISDFEIKYKI